MIHEAQNDVPSSTEFARDLDVDDGGRPTHPRTCQPGLDVIILPLAPDEALTGWGAAQTSQCPTLRVFGRDGLESIRQKRT